MPQELTSKQLEQQDGVDNDIIDLLNKLRPAASPEIEYNGELVGKIRDAVQEVLCNDLKLLTEMEFYPYIEEK